MVGRLAELGDVDILIEPVLEVLVIRIGGFLLLVLITTSLPTSPYVLDSLDAVILVVTTQRAHEGRVVDVEGEDSVDGRLDVHG